MLLCFLFLYQDSIKTKIEKIAKNIYGAEGVEYSKEAEEEINKIENYIEQALFYARSNVVEKDYYIIKCNL